MALHARGSQAGDRELSSGDSVTPVIVKVAPSARLMPVSASPLLATSSAKAGLISWKPAAARHGDIRKPAANEQATSAVLPRSSTVAATQSGYARIRA